MNLLTTKEMQERIEKNPHPRGGEPRCRIGQTKARVLDPHVRGESERTEPSEYPWERRIRVLRSRRGVA